MHLLAGTGLGTLKKGIIVTSEFLKFLEQGQKEFRQLEYELKLADREVEFYQRVLVQLVLAYGEDLELEIPASKGLEALEVHKTHSLQFGEGVIKLVPNVEVETWLEP